MINIQTIKEEPDPRIEMFIDLWKKYYSNKMEKCSDCDGFTIKVCEKALRDMLTAQVKRIDKITEDKLLAHDKEQEALRKQWLGYFEDIIDDANTLEINYISKEKPEWLGMIQGLKGPAYMGKNSINAQSLLTKEDI